LVTEKEGKQSRAIFRGAVSIKVIVSQVSEMEKIFRHFMTVERINTRSFKSTHIIIHGSNFTPSKPNKAHHVMSSDFTICGFFLE